jgi:hypothetical protein
MGRGFPKGLGERKRVFIAHFAANPDAELCDDCIRSTLNYSRSMFTEKSIRESALEAGMVKKLGRCLKCQNERLVIAVH